MKFRDFVGEKKSREIKKIVQTNIGPTEERFLKEVLRENTDGSKIKYEELGFNLSKKNLKRVFDYIKSWFIRYNVPFKPINPYLTLYLLNNVFYPQQITKKLRETKIGITYNPKGTLTVIPNKEKEYITLDYIPNPFHISVIENIFNDMDVNIIDRHCFVRLFEIESGLLRNRFYEDMAYSIPPIPSIKLGNVCFLRR
jgi:hypothetical protein